MIEEVLTLEETETLLLTGANTTGSTSSGGLVYSAGLVDIICLTGANCTLPQFPSEIKSVQAILPSSTCGHEGALVAPLEFFSLPVDTADTSALGLVPSTAELETIFLCGSSLAVSFYSTVHCSFSRCALPHSVLILISMFGSRVVVCIAERGAS